MDERMAVGRAVAQARAGAGAISPSEAYLIEEWSYLQMEIRRIENVQRRLDAERAWLAGLAKRFEQACQDGC